MPVFFGITVRVITFFPILVSKLSHFIAANLNDFVCRHRMSACQRGAVPALPDIAETTGAASTTGFASVAPAAAAAAKGAATGVASFE